MDLLPRLFRLFRRFLLTEMLSFQVFCKTEMRTADDGALKKNRMLILLNLLVNCHLLRNASFGLFFFLI